MSLPTYEIPQKIENEQLFYWDFVRKKWLIATPEEGVRQRFLHYLVKEKGISPQRIGVEKQIKVYERKKRFDVVVFDENGNPYLLCECKSPEVAISQATCYQIGQYNLALKAPYLVLTNGIALFCYEILPDGIYEARGF